MSLRKIEAVFSKQIKDTLKNKEVLLQFILIPVMALIMEKTITIANLPERYFVNMFSAMYLGMAPLTAMASIIAEEKEKNTLRVLMMSNVKAGEYLTGIGSYVLLACICGSCIMAFAGGYQGVDFLLFIGIMCIGIITSILIGAVIGSCSKNQMSATSITVPVMIVFSFLPMIATFNENFRTISRFTYSQQITNLVSNIGIQKPVSENFIMIGINMVIVLFLFILAYRQQKRA